MYVDTFEIPTHASTLQQFIRLEQACHSSEPNEEGKQVFLIHLTNGVGHQLQ